MCREQLRSGKPLACCSARPLTTNPPVSQHDGPNLYMAPHGHQPVHMPAGWHIADGHDVATDCGAHPWQNWYLLFVNCNSCGIALRNSRHDTQHRATCSPLIWREGEHQFFASSLYIWERVGEGSSRIQDALWVIALPISWVDHDVLLWRCA